MPFSNPIAGGNTLIRPMIQSPDYTPGTTGWAIKRDGTAEFNNATFRGEVDVVTESGASVRVYEDASGHPGVDFFSPTGELRGGIVYDPVSDGMFEFGPSSGQYYDTDGIFLENSTETNGMRFNDANGYIYSGVRSTMNDWINLTYQNGWTTRTGFYPLALKLFADGIVRMRGTMVPGSVNTVISNVPSQYRPSNTVQGECVHDNVTAGQVPRVNITPDGNITAFGMAGVGTTFSADLVRWSLV
jgi:hypothetical protein